MNNLLPSIASRNAAYQWRFAQVGGVPRVLIDSGDDIRHLRELDQKLWTVLSCPVSGLELDEATLRLMDYDGDGVIRVPEIVRTAEWLTSLIRDADLLLRGDDHLSIDQINTDSPEGALVRDSARRILAGLGRENDDVIHISDIAAFRDRLEKTVFNGDGVVVEGSTADPGLVRLMQEAKQCIGQAKDLSGQDGVTADIIERFYAEVEAYVAWQNEAQADTFPFAGDTEAAYRAFLKIEAKVDDYFTRCLLAAFDADACQALDVNQERIKQLADSLLTLDCSDIAELPVARVAVGASLPLAALNPAWADAMHAFTRLVLTPLDDDAHITLDQWRELKARFRPYREWLEARRGDAVASLGEERIRAIASEGRKPELLELVARDLELKAEFESIRTVHRLLFLLRDFYTLLRNFVTISDFYTPGRQAVFQAGELFIDQRCCKLCMRVSDMAVSVAQAPETGMFLIYCECTSKELGRKMTIVAALTGGDVQNISVGKHALFYDRQGRDWDARVVKIVDNPISIRQAFMSPYRKFAGFIDTQISKLATSKDEKMMSEATAKMDAQTAKLAETPVPPDPAAPQTKPEAKPKPAPFDIAKFCGIFAAIGMALGYIGGFLVSCVTGFVALKWWQMPLAIAGVLLLISGPSMILAWMKLRRRNLSPLLNANGWAINSRLKVNILFGATLTESAVLPVLNIKDMKLNDPFVRRRRFRKIYWLWIVVALLALLLGLYLGNVFAPLGLKSLLFMK